MFLPEYSITNKILKNIGAIEYAKALAENIPIMTSAEESLRKEASFITLKSLAENLDKTFTETQIKLALDGFDVNLPAELKNLSNAFFYSQEEEEDYSTNTLKNLYQILTGTKGQEKTSYREQKIMHYINPEEILASLVELMDWCQSVDALETHPVIFAGIVRAKLEVIAPFEAYNNIVSNLFTRMSLRWRSYNIKGFLKYESRFLEDKNWYQKAIYSIFKDEDDYTYWLEYFSEALAYDALDIKEKVMLAEKQTKTAVAQGITDLTERQEKIIHYLANYGTLVNKDFSMLFPNISEDSVLRDLKTLIEKGLVVKIGSTKSSKYKLKS